VAPSVPASASTTFWFDRCVGKDSSEPVWETHLAAHPDDVLTAACILNLYAIQPTHTDLIPRRIRLIRWVIENHPDIDLKGHLSDQDLRVSTLDSAVVSEVRDLWREQIARNPGNWNVLLNAGRSLALADPELTAHWLRHGRELQPDSDELAEALGRVYAHAIAGIVAYGRDFIPTAIDPARSHSAFAQQAWTEALQDPLLATATAVPLYNGTTYFRFIGIGRPNYDRLAEQLLERAQDLVYPAPARYSHLRDLYRNQNSPRLDPSERLAPKSRIVDLTSSEALLRSYRPPAGHSPADVPVPVEIVVGTDGHVWNSVATDPSSKQAAEIAQHCVESRVFWPLRIGQEPVRFRTRLTVLLKIFGNGSNSCALIP
jgi:hypothetical protein